MQKINSRYYKLLNDYMKDQCDSQIQCFNTYQLMEIFAQKSFVRKRGGKYLDTAIDYYIRPRTSEMFIESLNYGIDYFMDIERNATKIELNILNNYKKVRKILNSTKKFYQPVYNDISKKHKDLHSFDGFPQRKIRERFNKIKNITDTTTLKQGINDQSDEKGIINLI